MVEESVTDGKRIAQLLASEVTGLERGPLGATEVADAVPGAEPSDAGTEAYRLVRDGETVAVASLFPDRVELALWVETPWAGGEPPALCDDTGETLVVTSGVAVKRAVDVIRDVLESHAGNE